MNPLLEEIAPLCTSDFFNELAALPASLTLVRIRYYRAGPNVVEPKRAVFSKVVKPEFLRYLAQNHAADLKAMGLTATAIATMDEHGEFPRNNPGEQLDCSIDHILSLNFGGSNDFDNLTLLPRRINEIKEQLETLQAGTGSKGDIITIVPTHAAKVPFIEGGFQRAKAPHRGKAKALTS